MSEIKTPDRDLPYTSRGESIQGVIRKAKFQQAPFALSAATKVLRFKGEMQAGEIDLRGAIGFILGTDTALTAWHDSATTKTWSVGGTGTSVVELVDPSASTISINGTDSSVEVGGF